MDILGGQKLNDSITAFQNHSEYQKILGVILKLEIQMLLQRLAETGEESVVMTIKLRDGTSSVIGSNFGEQFIQGDEGHAINSLKEQFVRYCHNTTTEMKKEPEDVPQKKDNIKTVIKSFLQTENHSSPSSPRCQRPGRKKQGDKTDEAVSDLVQNIMKQAREQEISKSQMWRSKGARTPDTAGYRSKRVSLAALRKRRSEGDIDRVTVPEVSSEDQVVGECVGGDKAIEETVSQLVENIKAQAEMKEKQKMTGGYRQRRKRGRLSQPAGDCGDTKMRRQYTGRGRRPQSIADCFPAIVGSAETSMNGFADIKTVIKVEPMDNGYEDSTADKTNDSSIDGSEQCEFGKIVNVSGGVGEWADDRLDSQEKPDNCEALQNESQAGSPNNINVGSTCDSEEETDLAGAGQPQPNQFSSQSGVGSSEDVDLSMKIEINREFEEGENEEEEEELELPFVEEYYEQRGIAVEKVNVSKKESEPLSAPEICYKQSPRRPGKYNLIHRGYCYIKDKEGKGNTVYWKCGRMACKGRVIQRDGENIRTQDHNHSSTLKFENRARSQYRESHDQCLRYHCKQRWRRRYTNRTFSYCTSKFKVYDIVDEADDESHETDATESADRTCSGIPGPPIRKEHSPKDNS